MDPVTSQIQRNLTLAADDRREKQVRQWAKENQADLRLLYEAIHLPGGPKYEDFVSYMYKYTTKYR